MLNKQLAGMAGTAFTALFLITVCNDQGVLKKSGGKSRGAFAGKEAVFKMNE